MILDISLPHSVELQLIQDANEKGLSLDNYLSQIIKQKVYKSRQKKVNKKISESELLKKVTLNISDNEWNEYRSLNVIRKQEALSDKEHQRLIALGEKIEMANVERVKNLLLLAELRNVTLEKLMQDLEITPVEI